MRETLQNVKKKRKYERKNMRDAAAKAETRYVTLEGNCSDTSLTRLDAGCHLSMRQGSMCPNLSPNRSAV
jgi:hypothetical protein